MSSTYRPNVNNTHPGALTVLADNQKLEHMESGLTSCDGCISLATTHNYRSNFDKTFIPIYQSQLNSVDTNLETTKFAY